MSSFVKFRQVKQARYAKNGYQNALLPRINDKQLQYLQRDSTAIEGLGRGYPGEIGILRQTMRFQQLLDNYPHKHNLGH